MAELPSGTLTFLFTDIEGSTALLKRLGDRYAEVLDDHRRLLREAFAAQGGREIDTQGDSFFYVFARAKSAITAAIDAQGVLGAHEWPEGAEVRVRMGLHSGEPLVGEDRYVGIGVNRAARIGAAAHGGQVLISDVTRGLVEDDLPKGVFLRDLGYYRLKDIDRPERVSQVAAEGLQVEFPPLRGAERVTERPILRRRSVLAAALVGVIAAAVAIPVFALSSGGSGGSVAEASIGANSVGALDASTGRLLGSSALASTPGSVTAAGGAVWVTNPGGGTVSRIDPKKNAVVQTIQVGIDPSAIAVAGGFVWVTNAVSGTVSKVDPRANGGAGGAVDTIPAGNGPEGIAFGAGRVWVANSTDRTVMEFVPGSHQPVRTIPIAAGADAIAVGFGFVWVVSSAGNSVTRISTGSGTVLPAIGVGNDPIAVAVGAGAVWVANSLDGTVSRIDPGSGDVSGITVGGSSSGIAAGNGSVWVSDERAGTLVRIDSTGQRIGQPIKTGNRPGGLAVAANTLYVTVKPSGRAHRGGTLTVFPPDGVFDSIDPAVAYQVSSWSALILTNDGLVTFQRVGGNDGARLVPDLATAIPAPSPDGKTYTFQLRPGIRYSDGALVQPADFRRAIERSLEIWRARPPSKSTTGGYLTGIVGANACTKTHCDLRRGIIADPTSRTVTFRLVAPDPDFLDKLTLTSTDAVPENTSLNARLPLPATGPYMFKSYDAKQRAVLVRNPRFREWSSAAQPKGYPDEIVWNFGGSDAAHLNTVKRNRADYAGDVSNTMVAAALRREGYGSQLHINPTQSIQYFFLNTRLAPFNDSRVRRALNYAVDRGRLAKLLGPFFLVRPNCQVLPPNFAGYVNYCPYPHDLAKARRLVAESGTTGQTVMVWSVQPPTLLQGTATSSPCSRVSDTRPGSGSSTRPRTTTRPWETPDSTPRLARSAGLPTTCHRSTSTLPFSPARPTVPASPTRTSRPFATTPSTARSLEPACCRQPTRRRPLSS
jgi:peptide/nickel transport system substrate-binding protein